MVNVKDVDSTLNRRCFNVTLTQRRFTVDSTRRRLNIESTFFQRNVESTLFQCCVPAGMCMSSFAYRITVDTQLFGYCTMIHSFIFFQPRSIKYSLFLFLQENTCCGRLALHEIIRVATSENVPLDICAQ